MTSPTRHSRRQALRDKAKTGDLNAYAQLNPRETELILLRRRARLEEAHPTRALAVLAHIDLVIDPPVYNPSRPHKARDIVARGGTVSGPLHPGRPRRKRKVGRKSRRPGQNRRQFTRENWHNPDSEEQVVRELARDWRLERRERKEKGDGDMSGLLAVAAKLGAIEISNQIPGLSDPVDMAALAEWLYGVWGEVVHTFNPYSLSLGELEPEIPSALASFPGYLVWRSTGVGNREIH